jgi:hypothetical protein
MARDKRGPKSGRQVGPQVQERHAATSPVEAVSTIQVFYLFVTLLWETRGILRRLELLFAICLVFGFCLVFVYCLLC